MAHLSTIFAMMGSSDTIRFGSLEYPTLSPVGMQVLFIFEPSQAFLFGSLDFNDEALTLHSEQMLY